MPPFQPRFLVVSIGNPLPKYDSLHSAGHFVLANLPPILRLPALAETTIGRHACLASRGAKYTLVQSPTLMNLSGPFVAKAWLDTLARHAGDPASLALVVVHDDLDRALGAAGLVAWERSPRGHNGVKSVRAALAQDRWPESPFARVAVGIGRPEERDSETVSRYVLDRVPGHKRRVLEDEAPLAVARCLQELEDEWRRELEG